MAEEGGSTGSPTFHPETSGKWQCRSPGPAVAHPLHRHPGPKPRRQPARWCRTESKSKRERNGYLLARHLVGCCHPLFSRQACSMLKVPPLPTVASPPLFLLPPLPLLPISGSMRFGSSSDGSNGGCPHRGRWPSVTDPPPSCGSHRCSPDCSNQL